MKLTIFYLTIVVALRAFAHEKGGEPLVQNEVSAEPLSLNSSFVSAPFFVAQVESSYQDEELLQLWSSLSDIRYPRLDDYLKIEHYLKYGRRPYLDIIFNQGIRHFGLVDGNSDVNVFACLDNIDRSTSYANRILQQLMLSGAKGEMARQEIVALGGVSHEDRSRCVIMYSSYNYDGFSGSELYEKKMGDVIRDLEREGFQGHVLFRTGGYPMTDRGGLYLAHVPYSFKILSLIEASLLGYQDVLWLDTSVHPTNDLSELFKEIEKNGLYIIHSGINMDYDYKYGIIPDETLKNCDLSVQDLSTMPHIIATIIGVSFRNGAHHDFINEWYRLTQATLPSMSFYPEEFLLSVAAWRTHKCSSALVWQVMDVRSHIPIQPHAAKKPFWHDKS